MRGKRSKQYRKLMQQYGLSFGFREPYQVLLDADIIKDADRYKMDLIGGLERTLHGQVKPMITQCSMRHLYASASEPGVSYLIDKAKTYERRRCGHLPADYPEPLASKDCITSVVDPKGSKSNKHRYVVVSQDLETRKALREVTGVPLVYINRSVMIMEPMAGATVQNREREERGKFRDGLKRGSGSLKRKRDEDDAVEDSATKVQTNKVAKGPKGPNPLSMKKSKKKVDGEDTSSSAPSRQKEDRAAEPAGNGSEVLEEGHKQKRKRKHKSGVDAGGGTVTPRVVTTEA